MKPYRQTRRRRMFAIVLMVCAIMSPLVGAFLWDNGPSWLRSWNGMFLLTTNVMWLAWLWYAAVFVWTLQDRRDY